MYDTGLFKMNENSKNIPVPTPAVTIKYNIGKYHRVCERQKTKQIGYNIINAIIKIIVYVNVRAPLSYTGVNGKIKTPIIKDIAASANIVRFSHFLVCCIFCFAFFLFSSKLSACFALLYSHVTNGLFRLLSPIGG